MKLNLFERSPKNEVGVEIFKGLNQATIDDIKSYLENTVGEQIPEEKLFRDETTFILPENNRIPATDLVRAIQEMVDERYSVAYGVDTNHKNSITVSPT